MHWYTHMLIQFAPTSPHTWHALYSFMYMPMHAFACMEHVAFSELFCCWWNVSLYEPFALPLHWSRYDLVKRIKSAADWVPGATRD